MQFLGSDEVFREQLVISALKAYDEVIEKDQQGIYPLYRPRDWRGVERAEEKRVIKNEWFRGKEGKDNTVVFALPLQEANLRSGIKDHREIEGQGCSDGGSRKQCEEEGAEVSVLRKRDGVCGRGGKGGCRSTEVTYEVRCKKCDRKHI